MAHFLVQEKKLMKVSEMPELEFTIRALEGDEYMKAYELSLPGETDSRGYKSCNFWGITWTVRHIGFRTIGFRILTF